MIAARRLSSTLRSGATAEDGRPTFTNFIGNGRVDWLTRRVPQPKHNAAIAGSLLLVSIMWGGNNAGTKWLVALWPPIWTGGIRFVCAGLLLLAVLRFTGVVLGQATWAKLFGMPEGF